MGLQPPPALSDKQPLCVCYDAWCRPAVLLQGPAFNAEVASLQSELKLLKAANSQLTEDHKVRQLE